VLAVAAVVVVVVAAVVAVVIAVVADAADAEVLPAMTVTGASAGMRTRRVDSRRQLRRILGKKSLA
jgi:hypothetical protein